MICIDRHLHVDIPGKGSHAREINGLPRFAAALLNPLRFREQGHRDASQKDNAPQ
jgi:hypothetical protein